MEEMRNAGMSRVWRSGDAILREARPWSDTVHRLLVHLRAEGFARCPAFLGMTEDGREALSYVPGECLDDYPDTADLAARKAAAREMGRLARAFHDASASFARADSDVWMLSYDGALPKEVICHNDLGAYNVTFQNGLPSGLIDFDACCPAPRRWDLVYAAYRFAPLSREIYDPGEGRYRAYSPERDDEARRAVVAALYGGYGLPVLKSDIGLCADRLIALADFIKRSAERGDEAFVRMRAEGHEALYRADAEHVAELGARWFR